MAKLPQVLLLDPSSELTFRGSFDESSTSDLRLMNPSARPVYFKVKTTAPRYYCVRPNVGVIKPQQTVVINIVLQPVGQHALFEKEFIKHRFMVQSAFGPDEDVAADSFWKNVDPVEVMDSKVRVSFSQSVAHTPKKLGSEQSKSMSATSLRAQNDDDRLALKKEIELHKIYQDEKNRFERENRILNDDDDRLALQREIELRKIYQDEKNRLERENRILNEKLLKLSQVDQPTTGQVEHVDGFELVHILLIGFIVLCIGMLLGKIF